MDIRIKLLSENAKIPTAGTVFSAGYDLYSSEDGSVQPGERVLVKTNVSVAIPNGYYGRVAPRSGLAYKNGIDSLAGVIDSDYRGDIGVILLNTDSSKVFSFSKGDRIAQLIIEKCHDVNWVKVTQLEESKRNDGSYGSTGRN
jgi:dUTP pyrophosphatase